jgi:hypothetical protein
MTHCATLIICLTLASIAAAQEQQQWKPLFDGKTLAGWHQVGDGQWVVEDGAIVGKTQQAAKLYGLLVSDNVYHDCTVRLKFKSIKGNSGFYIRTVLESPDKAHGLQIEVDPATTPAASTSPTAARGSNAPTPTTTPRPSNPTTGTTSSSPPTAAT